MAADLEEAASKHEYHVLYRTLRRLRGKKADGTFVKSPTERLQRWKEFFEDLLNHDAPQGAPAEPPLINLPETPMTDTVPTTQELKAAIRSLKNGKSAGVDQVTA